MDRSSEFVFVYMTAGNREEARLLGRSLVEKRLAACANILAGMESVYWWDGAVQQDQEVVLIAKTRRSLLPDLIESVKALHSYDCPCVIALPILDGNADYLDWLEKETQSKEA